MTIVDFLLLYLETRLSLSLHELSELDFVHITVLLAHCVEF